jgi:hypothetical protein
VEKLIDMAARRILSASRLELAFGSGCPLVAIFRRLYAQLASARDETRRRAQRGAAGVPASQRPWAVVLAHRTALHSGHRRSRSD